MANRDNNNAVEETEVSPIHEEATPRDLNKLLERSSPFGVGWKQRSQEGEAYISLKMGNNRGAIVTNRRKAEPKHPDALFLFNGPARQEGQQNTQGFNIGGIWKNQDIHGTIYRAGNWASGGLLVIHLNPNKRKENDPDYLLSLCNTTPASNMGDTFDDGEEVAPQVNPGDDFEDDVPVRPAVEVTPPPTTRKAPQRASAAANKKNNAASPPPVGNEKEPF